MAARKLDLWCVLGEQIAVSGPQDPQLADFTFYAGDTYRLRLNAQTPITETGSLDRYRPSDVSEFSSFEAAIGLLDAPPDSATWKIRRQGHAYSAALAFDISPADLQAAIEGLAGVGTGKVEVTQGNGKNVYLIRPTNPADDFTFEVELSLVPLCTPLIRKGTDGSGAFTFLKLAKGYFAWAPDWEFPMPPPCEMAIQRAGTLLANCIQLLTIPTGAVGSLNLKYLGTATRVLEVSKLTAATVEAALNELFTDGATAPRFRCFQAGTNGIQIECIGALAKTDVAGIDLDLYGQVPLATPEAEFAITNLPIEIAVAAKDEIALVFEVVAINSEGRFHRLLHRTCKVVNTLIDPETSAAIGVAATRYSTVFVSADEEGAAEIIGSRSASVIAPGSGTVETGGTYEVNFTHPLNTLTPVIDVFELMSVSPEAWRQCASTEFDARTDGNPLSVTVTFPVTPPTSGHIGARKIFATNRDAQAWANVHRHPDTAIDCTGANAGKNLAQVLAILAGAMPSGWPTIPGSALADGSIDATKLNLTSLISTLFTPTGSGYAQTLTAMREIVKDPTLVTNLVTVLAANPALATTLTNLSKVILTKLSGTPELAAALQTTIASDPTLTKFFNELVLSALQDGTVLKDTVIFTVPDFSLTFPRAEISNGDLPNGDTDGWFPLPTAVLSAVTNDGNITGQLPNPTPSLKGHYRTVVGEAHTYYRDFTDGQLVYCTGFDWFPGALLGGKLYTTDGDAQLFTLEVNNDMLVVGTRFSLLAGLTLAQAGNCEGRTIFELKRGVVNTEIGGTLDGISTITWGATIFQKTLKFDATAITHNFGYSVSRTATNTFTATKTLYTTTTSAPAPTSGDFILGGFFSGYDTTNVPNPRGLFTATMKGVKASITKITA